MTLTSSVEVLIVGATPAGLTLAIKLARLGVNALLIDRLRSQAAAPSGALLRARSLEGLEEIDVASRLVEAGLPIRRLGISERERRLLTIDFSGLDTAYPFALMCPQDAAAAILRERLSQLGGRIRDGVEFLAVDDERGRTRIRLRSKQGEQVLHASWIVGCDGARSAVRDAAGLASAGGVRRGFLIADALLDQPRRLDQADLLLTRQGPLAVAPLPGGSVRIVAAASDIQTMDRDRVVEILDGWGLGHGGARVASLLHWSPMELRCGATSPPRSGRVLLCGSAAHVHDPLWGEGMGAGIEDALSLAIPLSAAIRLGDENLLRHWAARRLADRRRGAALQARLLRIATAPSGAERLMRSVAARAVGRVPGVPGRMAATLSGLERRGGAPS